MRVSAKGFVAVLAPAGGFSSVGVAEAQELHHGVDTCQNGYVWREAAAVTGSA